MGVLDIVGLTPLLERTSGRPEITVGLIDGPVALEHPDLASQRIREISGTVPAACVNRDSIACVHGTFVAGMLAAKRGSVAPAICPGCTLLVRPIFSETNRATGEMPSATPGQLGAAIIDCVNAGARVLNLSAALIHHSLEGEMELEEALNYTAYRNAIIVAAAGNQGKVGGSAITRHPCVIPVVACNAQGRPLSQSNLGHSIGKRGLSAPGQNITSLGATGRPQTFGGTSAAAPFVTGTMALLWSEFPHANPNQIRSAVTRAPSAPRRTIAPPLLDGWAAYQIMKSTLA
jgi:subtilisin family serine protease